MADPRAGLKETSQALRLITVRGEGLIKILDYQFNIHQVPDTANFNVLNQNWNQLFKTMVDAKNDSSTMNLLGEFPAVNEEEELKDFPSYEPHFIEVNLLPRDGKMQLPKTRRQSGVGVLLDMRLCRLKDDDFKTSLESESSDDFGLEEKTDAIQLSNQFSVGVNAKAISAIVMQLQADPPPEIGSDKYFNARFDAIYRKNYVAGILGRNLPIIILDAKKVPADYSFDAQQKDLSDFLNVHPENGFAILLKKQNSALQQTIPIEINERQQNSAPNQDFELINKVQNLLLEKISLQGEEIKRSRQSRNLMKLGMSQEEEIVSQETMIFKAKLDSLIREVDRKINAVDKQLASLKFDTKSFVSLLEILKTQENDLVKLGARQAPPPSLKYAIDYNELNASLANSNNAYLVATGLILGKDAYSRKDGFEQLYADFSRQLKLFKKDFRSSGMKTMEEFQAFLKSELTEEELKDLQEHYSQGPLLFAIAPLQSKSREVLGGEMGIMQPRAEDISNSMYKENDQVYIKSQIANFPITREDSELIELLEGPLETVFKLTDKGFEFVSLRTDSDFIADVFLGKEVSQDYFTANLPLDINAPEILQQYKEVTEKYLKHLEKSSGEKAQTKLAVVKKLQEGLYEGDYGCVLLDKLPKADKLASILYPYQQGYCLAENKLYFINAHQEVRQIEIEKPQTSEQPLSPKGNQKEIPQSLLNILQENSSKKTVRRISGYEMKRLESVTPNFTQVSPQFKIKRFRHQLKENQQLLTEKREIKAVTGLKSAGVKTVHRVLGSESMFAHKAATKLTGERSTHGGQFIYAINKVAKKMQAANTPQMRSR